ncbi:MAG TPA: hypothetical protein DEF05_09975 [Erwinia sp.]|uniref:hypothetical protein n=1 Tax=Erwinia citreus TaxID=558 RepID=UPI000E942C26|nr:hypothetical protein [Erwinia sp.]HBV39988.1 hypothetical protein [Erwinia sp.]
MDVIKDLAQVRVSEAMLRQVDVPGLLKSFKEDYDKLDNLKKDREKHEARHAVSRWWNSEELETAQLNAAELHASFAKKLGQLMMISIAQAQMLNEQQQQLQNQQTRIKRQTSEIAEANDVIKGQQETLAEQQHSLEELIKDYFELKGLTAEGAKQLILIAQEVKQTKEQLLEAFDSKLLETRRLHQQTELSLQQHTIAWQGQRQQIQDEIQAQHQHVADLLARQQTETSEALGAMQQQTAAVCEAFRQEYKQETMALRQWSENALSLQQLKLARLQKLAVGGLSVAAIALVWVGWMNRAMFGV